MKKMELASLMIEKLRNKGVEVEKEIELEILSDALHCEPMFWNRVQYMAKRLEGVTK